MGTSAHARKNIVGLIATVAVSSATMLWLFWRFPLVTGIATIVVLSAFGVSARLARMIETESRAEMERGNQSF